VAQRLVNAFVRAMRFVTQDEKDNAAGKEREVPVPVLYLRGRQERGDLERYVKGLRESGLRDVRGALIPDSGHFSPEEQPAAVARALRDFLDLGG
jgi:pimeloyl-ACP methyl ester carboxylesterase